MLFMALGRLLKLEDSLEVHSMTDALLKMSSILMQLDIRFLFGVLKPQFLMSRKQEMGHPQVDYIALLYRVQHKDGFPTNERKV